MHPAAWERGTCCVTASCSGRIREKPAVNKSACRIDSSLTKEGETFGKERLDPNSFAINKLQKSKKKQHNNFAIWKFKQRSFLAEQRSGSINLANYELNLQKSKTASAAGRKTRNMMTTIWR